jgi:hypothetical protein
MTKMEQIIANDTAWFEMHRARRMRVRRPSEIEIAAHPETNVIIVLQIEPGFRIRQGLCVPDSLLDFVLRNGEDSIGCHRGDFFILIPGCTVNGRVLK